MRRYSTSDPTTLADVYNSVHKIADEGSVEFLMERIYPTANNIRYLTEHQDERMVYCVSPLKMGLSSQEKSASVFNVHGNRFLCYLDSV